LKWRLDLDELMDAAGGLLILRLAVEDWLLLLSLLLLWLVWLCVGGAG